MKEIFDNFFLVRKIKNKKKIIMSKPKKLNHEIIKEHSIIPILGDDYQIIHSGKIRGKTYIEGDKLIVSGLEEHLPRKVKDFLKEILYKETYKLSLKYAKYNEVSFNKLAVKDLKTRWGSCSSTKNLSYNLRLVFLPYEVMEYVVAHEVCHLLEMNHSIKFWNYVEISFIDYKKAKEY